MSVNTDYFLSFSKSVGNVDPMLTCLPYKLPEDGVKSFQMNPDGTFKLEYEKERKGVVSSHNDDKVSSQISGTTVKVSKVVEGKIDEKNKIITIKTGSISASKYVFSANLLSLELKEGEGVTLTANCGFILGVKSKDTTVSLISGAAINWEK